MKGHIRLADNNVSGKPDGNDTDATLLIAFLLLLSTPLLHILRHLDDNRLTGFQWAFSDGGFERTLIYVIVATCAAYILSRSATAGRYPALSLFTLSMATAVSIFTMPEVIIDAGRYFAQAKYLEIHGPLGFIAEWGGKVEPWTDLPFVPFVYGIILKLFDETRISIQVFNALAFSLTAVTTYLIGKQLWDRQTGFFAGLLLIGMPYLLTQIPIMLIDIATMALVTLSVYFFIKVNKSGGAGWALAASVTITFTLLAKYSTWPMLLVLPLITFVFYKDGVNKSSVKYSVAIFAFTCLTMAPFLFYKADVFNEQIKLLSTYQLEGLGRWRESFTSTFLFQTSPFITIFALLGVWTSIKRKDSKFLIPCFFLFFTLVLQVGRIRYLVPLFPLLAIMASYGVLSVIKGRKAKARRFAVYGIAGLSIACLHGGFYPFLKSTSMVNLQMAGKFIDGLSCPEIGVYTLAQKDSIGNTEIAIPILDIYTDKKLIALNRQHAGDKRGAIAKSPLRFTWDIGLPEFYRRDRSSKINIAAIISSEPIYATPDFLPESVEAGERIKEFTASSGLFKFKTFVTIVGKGCSNTALSGRNLLRAGQTDRKNF
ncbi:hypothetical protein MNBD_NITROSPINAE04-1328 [hydrothermal vent metagenome]|uniref:Glycosyltransferase RgtA/B/C/D-like domain-containing protein n=1 Tax=hydrothermal vent metagenome TaxID=652676 RepID=A0A3B1BTF4_9ZZZZ